MAFWRWLSFPQVGYVNSLEGIPFYLVLAVFFLCFLLIYYIYSNSSDSSIMLIMGPLCNEGFACTNFHPTSHFICLGTCSPVFFFGIILGMMVNHPEKNNCGYSLGAKKRWHCVPWLKKTPHGILCTKSWAPEIHTKMSVHLPFQNPHYVFLRILIHGLWNDPTT